MVFDFFISIFNEWHPFVNEFCCEDVISFVLESVADDKGAHLFISF